MSRSKLLSAALAFAFAGCVATAQTIVTNVFDDLNKVIPDGQPTGMSDTENLTFSGPGFSSISDLKVTLTIANGYNGDFYAFLVHDSAFSVLLNRVGRTTGSPAGYSNAGMDVTFSLSGNDIHKYQTSSPIYAGNQLTGTWAPDGRYVDPQFVEDTDSRTSLLGSFNGTDPNGTWTLFLADLDFGAQGTLVKWGVEVTAIPEPSTWGLIGMGGFVLRTRLLRRRTTK